MIVYKIVLADPEFPNVNLLTGDRLIELLTDSERTIPAPLKDHLVLLGSEILLDGGTVDSLSEGSFMTSSVVQFNARVTTVTVPKDKVKDAFDKRLKAAAAGGYPLRPGSKAYKSALKDCKDIVAAQHGIKVNKMIPCSLVTVNAHDTYLVVAAAEKRASEVALAVGALFAAEERLVCSYSSQVSLFNHLEKLATLDAAKLSVTGPLHYSGGDAETAENTEDGSDNAAPRAHSVKVVVEGLRAWDCAEAKAARAEGKVLTKFAFAAPLEELNSACTGEIDCDGNLSVSPAAYSDSETNKEWKELTSEEQAGIAAAHLYRLLAPHVAAIKASLK